MWCHSHRISLTLNPSYSASRRNGIGTGENRSLGPHDFVLCADERTSIQARPRAQVMRQQPYRSARRVFGHLLVHRGATFLASRAQKRRS